MRKIILSIAISMVLAVQFSGCGSGSTVTLPQQQKNARLVFSVSTSASLPTPVRTLTLVARMPAGVTVPLNGDGTPVFSTPKSGLAGGSFVAPLLTITLADTSPAGLSAGNNVRTFAEINVSYPSGSSITEASFTGINNPLPGFTASGVDSTNTTVPLTGFLKAPAMTVTTF
jgi:hypothetical protein